MNAIDARGFRTDEEINLGSGLTQLAEFYQKGTIFYKAYQKDAVPSEKELQADLLNMIQIYRDFAEYQKNPNKKPREIKKSGDAKVATVKETIQNIKIYCGKKF